MATDPNEPIENPDSSDTQTDSVNDRMITYDIDQCIMGFPDEHAGLEDVPETTLSYNFSIVFENVDKRQEFERRPQHEQDEIRHTVENFVKEAANFGLNREVATDPDPNKLSESTLNSINRHIGPELVRIMNNSYPDLGLQMAGAWPESNQTDGCAFPEDKVELETIIPTDHQQADAGQAFSAIKL